MKKDKIFILHWRGGHTEEVVGATIAQAMTYAGYGAGALPALDYYEEKSPKKEPPKTI
jgi:hypothetical protein